MFLAFTAVYAMGQEQVQLSNLVGKWKLTKIEEVQLQGDTELSRQEYSPTNYSDKIPFEGFECTSDSKLLYLGKMLEGFKDGGNIQLNDGSNEVFFHGKQIGLPFTFTWQSKPTEFSLERMMGGNRQSTEKKMVKYYYKKE